MRQSLRKKWKQVPAKIRRPIVLTVGLSIVLLSGSIGWLPGPGGIPLFLVGVAILSSEYHWAQRFKERILFLVHAIGAWIKKYPFIGVTVIVVGMIITTTITYMFFIARQ